MADVGTHHEHNRRFRNHRKTRKSQGNTDKSNTLEGMTIQTVGNFVNHFGEIQDDATQIQWTPQAPTSQREVTFRLRIVIFSHYDANGVERESTFLQVPSPQSRAAAHELRRFTKWQNVDGTWRGWGQRDIPHSDDATIDQCDEEGNNHIIAPPNNQRTHHTETQPTATYTFIPTPPPMDQAIPPPPHPPTHIDTTSQNNIANEDTLTMAPSTEPKKTTNKIVWRMSSQKGGTTRQIKAH